MLTTLKMVVAYESLGQFTMAVEHASDRNDVSDLMLKTQP